MCIVIPFCSAIRFTLNISCINICIRLHGNSRQRKCSKSETWISTMHVFHGASSFLSWFPSFSEDLRNFLVFLRRGLFVSLRSFFSFYTRRIRVFNLVFLFHLSVRLFSIELEFISPSSAIVCFLLLILILSFIVFIFLSKLEEKRYSTGGWISSDCRAISSILLREK